MIKTVSLETAKLLKEAGFRQDSFFKWEAYYDGVGVLQEFQLYPAPKNKDIEGCRVVISAPTTDELLENLELPFLRIERHNDCFIIEITALKYSESNMSLCEGLAGLWLWLKKEGLI